MRGATAVEEYVLPRSRKKRAETILERKALAMTLTESVLAFLRSCETDKNLSSLTLRAYKTDLCQFEVFTEQHAIACPTAIDVGVVQAFIETLKTHNNCVDITIRRKIAVVRAYLRYLDSIGAIPTNPMAKMRLSFRCSKKLPRVLSREQVQAVLSCAKTTGQFDGSDLKKLCALRNHALLELLFFSGARISELLRMDVEDLNLNTGCAHIKGKGRRERTIYLGCAPVISSLKKYLEFRDGMSADNQAVFLNTHLGRLSVYTAESVVRKCAEAAGITSRMTPHMFRHTMATMLLENGADIRSIQEILGHASIKTTEIYTHISAARKKQVMAEFHPRHRMALRRRRSA